MLSTVTVSPALIAYSSIDKSFALTSFDNDQNVLGVVSEDNGTFVYANNALVPVCIKGFVLCKKDSSGIYTHGQIVTSSASEPGTVKPVEDRKSVV